MRHSTVPIGSGKTDSSSASHLCKDDRDDETEIGTNLRSLKTDVLTLGASLGVQRKSAGVIFFSKWITVP